MTGKGKHKLDFVEQNFEIHGEFEGKVYHTKRNGVVEKYDYDPVSHYERVPLTIRNEWIRRYAVQASNPRQSGYKAIIRKLNYYTPYILPAGKQKLTGGTAFYVRERGEYEFRWQGSPAGSGQVVGKRTKLSFNFCSEGEFTLECRHEDELYCLRWFIITGNDLDIAYESWLAAHFDEILSEPEPEYESLKTYRRGMRSKVNWAKGLEGGFDKEVIYQVNKFAYKDDKRQRPWLYHRQRYNHSGNPQTQLFNEKMQEIGAAWRILTQAERDEWNKKAQKYKKKRWTGYNLFTKEYWSG
jgi:hypothetical protein